MTWELQQSVILYMVNTPCYPMFTLGANKLEQGDRVFLVSVKNSTGNIENKEQNVQYLYLVCNDIRLNVSSVM